MDRLLAGEGDKMLMKDKSQGMKYAQIKIKIKIENINKIKEVVGNHLHMEEDKTEW